MANAYKDLNNTAEAITLYWKVIGIDKSYLNAYLNLGNLLMIEGNIDEAIYSYKKAIEIDAQSVDAHLNLAIALRDQGYSNDAISCYQHIIDFAPDHISAYVNLGNILREEGRPDYAISCYKTAIEKSPTFAEIYLSLAIVLRQEGEYSSALIYCNKALVLKPNFTEAYLFLADYYIEINSFDDAYHVLSKIDHPCDQTVLLVIFNHLCNGSAQKAVTIADEYLATNNSVFIQALKLADFCLDQLFEQIDFLSQFSVEEIHRVLKDYMKLIRYFPSLKVSFDFSLLASTITLGTSCLSFVLTC